MNEQVQEKNVNISWIYKKILTFIHNREKYIKT